jgi:hypothetical protein
MAEHIEEVFEGSMIGFVAGTFFFRAGSRKIRLGCGRM